MALILLPFLLLLLFVAACLGGGIASLLTGVICHASGVRRTVSGVFLWPIPLTAGGALLGLVFGWLILFVTAKVGGSSMPTAVVATLVLLIPVWSLLGAVAGLLLGLARLRRWSRRPLPGFPVEVGKAG